MKTNGHKPRKAAKLPVFVTRAERAMRRAAKGVQAQSRALNLPVAVWQDGKLVEKPAGEMASSPNAPTPSRAPEIQVAEIPQWPSPAPLLNPSPSPN